jgi:hypothetical protein
MFIQLGAGGGMRRGGGPGDGFVLWIESVSYCAGNFAP